MKTTSPRYCQFCGAEYVSANPLRKYCSERCRRQMQNERRLDWREQYGHSSRGVAEYLPWEDDPWDSDDYAILANALTDPAPQSKWCIVDNVWGGPSAIRVKTEKKRARKGKEDKSGWLWLI